VTPEALLKRVRSWRGSIAAAAQPRRQVEPRALLVRHLIGSGVELGPGHHPFVLPLPGVRVSYVDRLTPAESEELFPNLGAYALTPDVEADFDTDRLTAIADASQDFVVASHVLEHLAESLGFLAEIHRVLRPGGIALLLLPDRHRTRDRNRKPTPLEHLVLEYESRANEVSDAHLIEFLEDRGVSLLGTPEERRHILATHRRRSIHVHCWDDVEILELILWGIERIGSSWEFVDGCISFDGRPPADIEFGYVLRRSQVPMDPVERKARFETTWSEWREAQRVMLAPPSWPEFLALVYRRVRRQRNPL